MIVGLGGRLKQAWHEVPHLVAGGVILIATLTFGAIGGRRYNKYEMERTIWKRRYTVVREEDFDPNKQIYPPEKRFPMF